MEFIQSNSLTEEKNLVQLIDYFQRVYGNYSKKDACLVISGKKGNAKSLSLSEAFLYPSDLVRIADFVYARRNTYSLYVGIALQDKAKIAGGRGTADTALAVPGFGGDFDYFQPGHHKAASIFPSKEAALQLIEKFPFPPSLLIHSGGGFQPQWLFTDLYLFDHPDKRVTYQKVSSRLQKWFRQQAPDVTIDNVGNCAQLFRIPFTRNLKVPEQPKTVELVYFNENRYSFEEIAAWLDEQEPAGSKAALKPQSNHGNHAKNNLADANKIIPKCGFMKEVTENQAHQTEPQWLSMGSILVHCENGKELIHKFSKQYPGYSREETEQKFARYWDERDDGDSRTSVLRPHTCEHIESVSGACQTCPYLGKIKSPIALGYAKPEPEESITMIKVAIEQFREAAESGQRPDDSALVNADVFGQLIELEKDVNTMVKATSLENEITGLTGLGKRGIKQFKKSLTLERLKSSEYVSSTSPSRFYMPNINGNMEFKPALVAEEILSEHHFIFDHDSIYIYTDGVYDSDTARDTIDYLITRKLGDDFSARRHRDVLLHLTTTIKSENRFTASLIHDEYTRKYINVKNGLLDWRTGKLIEHTPDMIFRNQIPVNWNVEADRQLASRFIQSVVPNDTVHLIEEWVGYCLTPSIRYQKLLLVRGSGNNGKSAFLAYCKNLVGRKNVSHVELQELDGHRFKVAGLKDKLMNVYADIDFKRLQGTSVLKNLVVGDEITAEEKGGKPFVMKSYAKLMFSANEIPSTSDNSDGFFRRLFIVPFDRKFEGTNRDRNMEKQLNSKEYLESLLLVAIDGLRRLEANGEFSESASVRRELEIFEFEQKPIAQFLEDECVLHTGSENREYKVSKEELFSAYRSWCERNGRATLNNTNFFKQLYRETGLSKEKNEFQPRINGKQIRYISGITLQEEEEEDENPFDM